MKPFNQLDQRTPGAGGVTSKSQQARDLSGMPQDRQQNADQTYVALRIERDRRGRRKVPFSRIADRSYNEERQPICGCNFGNRAAFQVDGMCVRFNIKPTFRGRISDDLRPREQSMGRRAAEQCGKPFVRIKQLAIGARTIGVRMAGTCRLDRHQNRRNNHRTRPQIRVQPTGKPEADERRDPLLNQSSCRPGSTLWRTSTCLDRITEPAGDARLRHQSNHKAKDRFIRDRSAPAPFDSESRCRQTGQNPTSTRRTLPRDKFRYRAKANKGKYSL